MPTYEYECVHCKHKFEAVQKMSDKHLTACPKCKKQVKRLIGSGIGIIFKGSGFYATDYKKKTASAESGTPAHPIRPGVADNGCPKEKNKDCSSCPHAK